MHIHNFNNQTLFNQKYKYCFFLNKHLIALILPVVKFTKSAYFVLFVLFETKTDFSFIYILCQILTNYI